MNSDRIITFCPATTFFIKKDCGLAMFHRFGKTHTLTTLSEEQIIYLEKLKNGIGISEVDLCSNKKILGMLELLNELNLIAVRKVSKLLPLGTQTDQQVYYSAFSEDTENIVKKLQDSTILIIGIGGLGIEILRHFVAVEVGSILCIDDDDIELSNLNRQLLFTSSDIGSSKVEVIKNYYSRAGAVTKIETAKIYISSSDQIEEVCKKTDINPNEISLIVCAADEPIGTIELACIDFSFQSDIACMIMSMHIGRGNFSFFTNKSSLNRAREFYLKVQGYADMGNSQKVRGSAGWENSMLSSMCAGIAIKYIGGFGDGAFDNKLSKLDCLNGGTEHLISF